LIDISNRFTAEMDKIGEFVRLMKANQELAGHGYEPIRARNSIKNNISNIVTFTRNVGAAGHHFDGAYLSACALFELVVRELITKYVSEVNTRIESYHRVPEQIKKWHTKGCVFLLSNSGQDRFKHIDTTNIIKCMASCLNPSTRKPYKLSLEAFSYHDNNMRSGVIEEMVSNRIGISNIWMRVAALESAKRFVGSNNEDTVHRILKEKLDKAIKRRNDIIHRGREYYTAGETEVADTALLFKFLIECLADRFQAQLDAL